MGLPLPPDDEGAEPLRDRVDDCHGDEHHEDDGGGLVPFQHADLFGEHQADAAGADDADDGGGAGVAFEIVEHLAGEHRQHLGHDAEADGLEAGAAGGQHAFDRAAVGGFDRLAHELGVAEQV